MDLKIRSERMYLEYQNEALPYWVNIGRDQHQV